MTRPPVKINVDKKQAAFIYIILVLIAFYLLFTLFNADNSQIDIFILKIVYVLFTIPFCFYGISTLFSRRFIYKDDANWTQEGSDDTICSCSYLIVYSDKLVIKSIKIVHFNDIVCIKAIPCYFRSSPYSEENDVDYFTEIILQTNKKIVLGECEDHFIEAFKKHKNIVFKSWLTLDDMPPKFSMTKYFFASLIGELSPFRVTLWADTSTRLACVMPPET